MCRPGKRLLNKMTKTAAVYFETLRRRIPTLSAALRQPLFAKLLKRCAYLDTIIAIGRRGSVISSLQEIEGKLAVGFHALYSTLWCCGGRDGRVTSVCLEVGKDATRKKLLSDNGFSAYRLIQINSNRAVPELSSQMRS